MKILKLEAIRGFAAIYVVFYHIFCFSDLKDLTGPLVRLPFRFGQEAVILFFLMSGFVICLAFARQKRKDFKPYFIRRFARIYPIAILSFLVSAIIYRLNGNFLQASDYDAWIGNLLMLQDLETKPGMWFATFLKNGPLWSLSYEWWFYMLFFPLVVLINKYSRQLPFPKIYLILAISVLGWASYLAYFNHFSLIVSYLVLWWAGVACAEIYMEKRDFPFRDLKHVFIALFLMTGLTFIPVVTAYLDGVRTFSHIAYPIIVVRHFGFALVALIAGYGWWRVKLVGFDILLKPFTRLAPISYALYIVHVPLIWLKLPWMSNLYLEMSVKLVMMFVLAYVLEVKIQPVVNGWFAAKKEERKPVLVGVASEALTG